MTTMVPPPASIIGGSSRFVRTSGPMILASAVTARTESDLTTLIGCDGTCGNWPILNANGNVLTDEYGAQGDDAKTDLAGVLHQLYPVDNTDPLPGTSGRHCVAGYGWVHAREYDFYLRSFGQ